MYFDYRLWLLTAGLRARMAGGVALGLTALLAGIARYVFLASCWRGSLMPSPGRLGWPRPRWRR